LSPAALVFARMRCRLSVHGHPLGTDTG
jgi:hypothetical protein